METTSPIREEPKPANNIISGTIYQRSDGRVVHEVKKPGEPGYGEPRPLIDTTLPEEHRAEAENVKTRTIVPEGGSIEDIIDLHVYGVHPDEVGVQVATEMVLAGETFPRTEIYDPHILASVTGTRGAHRPATVEEIENWPEVEKDMPRNKGIMLNMEAVSSDPNQKYKVDPVTGATYSIDPETGDLLPVEGSLGVYVNLNRGFEQPENPIPWRSIASDEIPAVTSLEETYSYLGSKEAVLLAEAIRLHPNAQILITWHEDYDRGGDDNGGKEPGKRTDKDGIYIYRCVADAQNDPLHDVYTRLHNECMEELMAAGFDVFEGPDDPDDPDLGLFAHKGLIYQSLKNEDGEWEEDKTYEGFAVRSGAEGLSKIMEALTIETPMHMPQERKNLMAEILMRKLIKPLLHYYGVPHTETEEAQSE